MAHAFRAGALATAVDKALEPEFLKSLTLAEDLASSANERERLPIRACRACHAWGLPDVPRLAVVPMS